MSNMETLKCRGGLQAFTYIAQMKAMLLPTARTVALECCLVQQQPGFTRQAQTSTEDASSDAGGGRAKAQAEGCSARSNERRQRPAGAQYIFF